MAPWRWYRSGDRIRRYFRHRRSWVLVLEEGEIEKEEGDGRGVGRRGRGEGDGGGV